MSLRIYVEALDDDVKTASNWRFGEGTRNAEGDFYRGEKYEALSIFSEWECRGMGFFRLPDPTPDYLKLLPEL
jgi:hypothetical protein